jgi:hypothetical protein
VCRDGLSIAAMSAWQRSTEVCMAAVKQNGLAVFHLTSHQRTPAVCLAAVQQNGRAIQHLSPGQRTPAVCLAAVRRSGFALHYLLPEERTPEVCLAAVMQDGWVIEMLKPEQRTPQVCLAATEQELSPEVCLAAITRNKLTARQLPVAQMLRPPMSHWIRDNWNEFSRLVDPSNAQALQLGLGLPALGQDSGFGASSFDSPGRGAPGSRGVSATSPLPPRSV